MSDRRTYLPAPPRPMARELPYCVYPTAAEASRHGLQPLPRELRPIELRRAAPYRTRAARLVPLDALPAPTVLDAARVVARSFAEREPQCRHLRPPAAPSPQARSAEHTDAFGRASLGAWSRAELLYWFIRLLVLTDAASPRGAVRRNDAALRASLALLDDSGAVLGAALYEPMPAPHECAAPRADDPLLAAVWSYVGPVLEMLLWQDAEALAALGERYADFAAALAAGRVGHHFMVARGDGLPRRDAFELVAGSAERFAALGFAYMVVEATNQWTGAACEVLGGVRVHFAPFRAKRVVPVSAKALPDSASSRDGFLSDKDSGSMFYVLRLGG